MRRTFMLGANINVCVEMFVNNRTYDGGPSAWIQDNYSMVANQFGNAAFVVGNFLADSVLVRTRSLRCVNVGH
jgi:hypothetical protein